MKKMKRATAVILSLVLVASTILGQTYTKPAARAAGHGIDNPVTDSEGVTTWGCIYFGNYWQSDTNGDGVADQNDAKQPIKWRVLSVDGDDAFLLADQNLDCQPYNTKHTDVTWETCTLRAWLNDTFYQNAFSSAEQSAIRTTITANKNNPYHGTSGGNDTFDKIYLLSFTEAGTGAYGFNSQIEKNSETRIATNTAYTANANPYMSESGSSDIWWLRSPGVYSEAAAIVGNDGYGDFYGGGSVECGIAVRPALHINLNGLSEDASSIWSNAGTVSSNGGNIKPVIMENPYGLTNPIMNDSFLYHGVTTWDCIWFGNYYQSNDTTKEPIKWRVLSVDGDDAFLLADQNLDWLPYHDEEDKSVTWETCTLRAWLNGSFLQTAFSTDEQGAIRATTVVNDDNAFWETSGGNDTLDKVYLLSIAEATNDDYGFDTWLTRDSRTRVAVNTAYANNKKLDMPFDEDDGSWWWLRSPGERSGEVADGSDCASVVAHDGRGYSQGDPACLAQAVRPILHIDLSSSTWSKAGTVNSLGVSTDDARPSPSPSPSGGNDSSVDNDEKIPPSETKKPDGGTTIPSGSTGSTDATPTPPSNNTKLKDGTGTTYTVTNAGAKKGEVAYTAPKNAKVTSVTIPATVRIGDITYKVTSIKASTFKKCKKLKKVTIGKNIMTIGKNAFYGCTKLKTVTIKTTKLTNKSVGSKAFAGIHAKAIVKVPKSKLPAYKKLLKKKGITGKKQRIKK